MDGDVVKCPQPLCDFRTQRAENLAIHLQRHAPLDVALSALQRQRVQVVTATAIAEEGPAVNPDDDDDDEAMQATTEVALKMAKENEVHIHFVIRRTIKRILILSPISCCELVWRRFMSIWEGLLIDSMERS